ncbi:guanitoxin biosynthesis pre-guanitoxin forming N-methyltransferase GntF [Mesorhizobium sp. IMUNJ 23232]|uniref:guanitoxin biosynthesis pre-guanitoxin forming N-methyltransferase GntF n=1 Tax=Mesorhizobium sp. IMUNJ 23232 TaxID=3376064 RepID=UPI0037A41EDB
MIFLRIPAGYARTKSWLISGLATVASTYALDVLATVAGASLLVSGMLAGANRIQLIVFLALTYLVWGAGLRVNLAANWRLIRETGTSSSILSKAVHDLVAARSDSRLARRIAADTGYVCFELAKEAPYYVGAFGAAILTETISSNEAIIFLGGANLGAAAYEYGLARLVRTFFLQADEPAYASFDADWRPDAYLEEYYDCIAQDERETIAFFVEAMGGSKSYEPILFFGVGPALHHVFLAGEAASEIHLGEYLEANLDEIRRWLRQEDGAHDWRPFVRYTLQCEGIVRPTDADIDMREWLVRQKTRKLFRCDLRQANPLGRHLRRQYGMVVSAYCADSATGSKDQWFTFMQRIIGLVRPGGTLMTAALWNCHGYLVGGQTFPSPRIGEEDLRAALKSAFDEGDMTIRMHELGDTSTKGYPGILLACARCRK